MPDHMLRVGIDASNILHGGGFTHLTQILQAADPAAAGVGEVIVWARADVLSRLPDRPWLTKRSLTVPDRRLVRRAWWQQFALPGEARRLRCDVLFAPGGMLPRHAGLPTVTMSRNMLPFEPTEAARFGRFSRLWFKMQLLRRGQTHSLRHADGVIFLTRYARDAVMRAVGARVGQDVRIIPHGLADRFFLAPRRAVEPANLDEKRPFRLLYVSTVDVYKHQWHVVRAAGRLRRAGRPVRLDLVGPPLPGGMALLNKAIAEVDPTAAFVTYRGDMSFDRLHEAYAATDAFVFASSCENLPNILLEAMAAGLPIASSDMGPMPEVLGDAGVYFDPLDDASIARAVESLIVDPALRERLAEAAHRRACDYSWSRCAADTFSFIAQVARRQDARAA